jgi:hypothetical protein
VRSRRYRNRRLGEFLKELELTEGRATGIPTLVALNWLTMTIPDKPTSPKQQYLTTLKGRLVLEFLKRHAK